MEKLRIMSIASTVALDHESYVRLFNLFMSNANKKDYEYCYDQYQCKDKSDNDRRYTIQITSSVSKQIKINISDTSITPAFKDECVISKEEWEDILKILKDEYKLNKEYIQGIVNDKTIKSNDTGIKRFMIFMYCDYDPNGGIEDYIGSVNTPNAARTMILNKYEEDHNYCNINLFDIATSKPILKDMNDTRKSFDISTTHDSTDEYDEEELKLITKKLILILNGWENKYM